MSKSLSHLLEKMRPVLQQRIAALPSPWPQYTLFLSFSDGRRRAAVVHASGTNIDSLWSELSAACQQLAARRHMPVRWLRADWVTRAQPLTWKALRASLKVFKRNYFRYGLALDANFQQAFLEGELNGNAMLYGGGQVSHAVINEKNFSLYAGQRFAGLVVDFTDDAPVYLLTTEGLFCDLDTQPLALHATGHNAGRRVLDCDADAVRGMIERGSNYLASQVRENGRFHYGWHPCFDRPINAYNTLRHASTLYSMLEAWEVTREPELAQAIERGLGYLCTELIQRVLLPTGERAAFLLDVGNEIKLGGNAVCLLALGKYSELFDTEQHLPLLEELALGIRHMQNPDSGEFVHVLNYPALDVKAAFRIIYYDGEAAFGLMRLYRLTGDERWLAMVEQAFDSFIAREHWKAHDHWLGYCVNELTLYRPEERYFRFGIRNVADHLDFVLKRITTFPTLLELMMAAQRMLERIAQSPEHRHLLSEIDLDKFDRALHHRAAYLMNGHFWPEYAMYFRNPARILGSFFIRHQAFRVRIDDVEHYLSGMVAYHSYLLREQRPPARQQGISAAREHRKQLAYQSGPNWTPERLLQATGGRWVRPPAPSWRATGLCIWAPSLQPGQMVTLRPAGGRRGINPVALAHLPFTPQALLTQDDDSVGFAHIPLLRVQDINQAILAMGQFARQQMLGKVIGVTGSAGKTSTVAMLTRALQPWGEVGRTAHNANLPHGIAWNLASIAWDAPHTVLEMAIGNMSRNSLLVKPDIAVVTNIGPAHLEYHRTTEAVAIKKGRIFEGMNEQGVAVLNRDMEYWEVLEAHARARGLQVLHYGRHPDAEVRLERYSAATSEVQVVVADQRYNYRLGAPGEHMAANSLACIAVALALGLPLEPMLAQFSLFQPLAGRGVAFYTETAQGRVRVMDEAYNANPVSMRAALALLADTTAQQGRKVAVLGDMLELGEDADRYHAQLAAPLLQARPELLLLCGEHMKILAQLLDDRLTLRWYPTVKELNAALVDQLRGGDVVLIKSSGATGLSSTVEMLRHSAA
jgi:UDP-N-acetylmuramoyl-tripeptide--D-alanyl-D-alanine ligase